MKEDKVQGTKMVRKLTKGNEDACKDRKAGNNFRKNVR
jgi:hypothetical protein